jgi:hypothetical protein
MAVAMLTAAGMAWAQAEDAAQDEGGLSGPPPQTTRG